jgi:hypothetical protein
MHEPAAHGHHEAPDRIEEPRPLERVRAAVGQRQIDGAARLGRLAARIGATLIQRDGHAPPLEQKGEQRAGRSRADDADGLTRQAHALTAAASASTAAATSRNEL